MKKLTALLLALVMALSLTACGDEPAPTNPPTNAPTNAPTAPPTDAPTEAPTTEPTQAGRPGGFDGGSAGTTESNHVHHEVEPGTEGAATVYFTSDISPEGLMAIYEALGVELTGENIAVKLHTGESQNSNHLRPDFIKGLIQHLDATIVECNTAYGGNRSSTAMHYQLAEDHGFTAIAKVVIMDEEGSISLPVNGGTVLTENKVGARFAEFDGMLILSHFKGHMMGGFGGAIKNMSIGIASTEGKCLIHTGGESSTSPWGGSSPVFMDSMAEAAKSVVDALDGNIIYISVMNNLSIDCDCNGYPGEPDIHDIGILASTDPVALDQACVDLIYNAEGNESFTRRIESVGGEDTLEHGEEIGLGTRSYFIVNIDEQE